MSGSALLDDAVTLGVVKATCYVLCMSKAYKRNEIAKIFHKPEGPLCR
jgi:hypothetical protein